MLFEGHLSRENRVVTKKEIVKAISEETGLTQLKTKEIVQKTFDAIVETLVREGRIELRNFGVFEVKKRAARKARNPRTGERVDVAEKYVVTFKPGKDMEEQVRKMEEQEAENARQQQQQARSQEPERAPVSERQPVGSHHPAASTSQTGEHRPPRPPEEEQRSEQPTGSYAPGSSER